MSTIINLLVVGMIIALGFMISDYSDNGIEIIDSAFDNSTTTFNEMESEGLGNALIKGLMQAGIPIVKMITKSGFYIGQYLGIEGSGYLIITIIVLMSLLVFTPSFLWIAIAIGILIKDWRKNRRQNHEKSRNIPCS